MRVDWGAIRRSREAGVDLSMIEEMLGDFYRGSDRLITALWAVLSPTAKSEGIDKDTFESSVSGEAIAAARDALIESVAAFFPSDRRAMITVANSEVAHQIATLLKSLPQASPSESTSASTEQPENAA